MTSPQRLRCQLLSGSVGPLGLDAIEAFNL
jgi:hypothetical protein